MPSFKGAVARRVRGGRRTTCSFGQSLAILLLNRGNTDANITVLLAETGFLSEVATVVDAWTGTTQNVTKSINRARYSNATVPTVVLGRRNRSSGTPKQRPNDCGIESCLGNELWYPQTHHMCCACRPVSINLSLWQEPLCCSTSTATIPLPHQCNCSRFHQSSIMIDLDTRWRPFMVVRHRGAI